MHRRCTEKLCKYFTSSDEEGAAQPAELMVDEGDPTDQQEAPSQSCSQAQDNQQGPETPKHWEKHSHNLGLTRYGSLFSTESICSKTKKKDLHLHFS